MKKNSCCKGLLLDWLRKALDEELYSGLKWHNRKTEVFYIHWTHKSAEHWSEDNLEPFRAWAEFKGKYKGKNAKQLKATFRCALNSKKELKEVSRDRSGRYWQFVDPDSNEIQNASKKCRKVISGHVDVPVAQRNNDHASKSCMDLPPSLRISSSNDVSKAEVSTSPRLPNFEYFNSFTSLTPPHQANEIFFNSNSFESKLPQQKVNSKESYKLNGDLFYQFTSNMPNIKINNVFTNSVSIGNANNESNTLQIPKLPSFETFCNFLSLTPPPQKEDSSFNFEEQRDLLSPEQNPLKSSSKDLCSTIQINLLPQSSTDVWQPNGWTTSLAHQDLNCFNQFFSDDFDMMPKPLKQKTDKSYKIDFTEMDQSVPVMDVKLEDQTTNRNSYYHNSNKTVIENNLHEPMNTEYDCLLSYVDPEACERIVQELERSSPECGLYSYNS